VENFTYHYPILRRLKTIYFYRIIQIIIIIISCSYFLGIFWRIFVHEIIDWEHWDTWDVYNGQESFYANPDFGFVDEEGIHANGSRQNIMLSYYALTTLSTVGYGDFLPQNYAEKLLMSFILLIGVTIFSLIMNKLMDVMKDFKDIGYTEGCNPRDLAKWVGLLAKINNGVPLRKDLVTSIEDFFDFYWANDRMRTLKSEADQRITNELQDTFV